MFEIKIIFICALLMIGFLTFCLSFAMILNLYCFKFLRDKLKGFYYYFCNIIALIISITIVIVVWIFTNINLLIIVLEFLVLIGVIVGTNESLLKRFKVYNSKYDNDKSIFKLISNNAASCYLRNIIVWIFYVISVVINSLLKLKIITISDEALVFMFESAEYSAIILLAVITLFENIRKRKKIKHLLEITDCIDSNDMKKNS